MKKIIPILLLWILGTSAAAQYKFKQEVFLKIGQPCPNLFFNEVLYDHQKTSSVSAYIGRWLILDFWNKSCGTCIEKMPGMDSMQRKFQGKAHVLLVGYTGSMYRKKPDTAIRTFYANIRRRMHVQLPIAYDSVQFHRLAIGGCPYVIVVDPKGIIRAVTSRFKSSDLSAFIAGRTPILEKATNRNGL